MIVTTQQAFGQRLQSALKAAGISTSPTVLQRKFNTFSDDKVTVHAVRKWIIGESAPTQAKVEILAALLGVTPNWLRFGEGDRAIKGGPSLEQREIGAAMMSLSAEHRSAVLSLVHSLAGAK